MVYDYQNFQQPTFLLRFQLNPQFEDLRDRRVLSQLFTDWLLKHDGAPMGVDNLLELSPEIKRAEFPQAKDTQSLKIMLGKTLSRYAKRAIPLVLDTAKIVRVVNKGRRHGTQRSCLFNLVNEGTDTSKYTVTPIDDRFRQIVQPHVTTLARKYLTLVTVDEYGFVERDAWDKELNSFAQKALRHGGFSPDKKSVSQATLLADTLVMEHISSTPLGDEATTLPTTPREYEEYCATLLTEKGWNTTVTPYVGDKGVDVIAERGGKRLVLQAKFYQSGSVGSSAVQEVYTAKGFYECDAAVVVSPAPFTRQARVLADAIGVRLLYTDDLKVLSI